MENKMENKMETIEKVDFQLKNSYEFKLKKASSNIQNALNNQYTSNIYSNTVSFLSFINLGAEIYNDIVPFLEYNNFIVVDMPIFRVNGKAYDAGEGRYTIEEISNILKEGKNFYFYSVSLDVNSKYSFTVRGCVV